MWKNLVGNQYRELTVTAIHSKTRNGHIRYTCKCSCGNEKNILGTHLIQRKTISCGCKQTRSGIDHKQWTGVGEMSGDFWANHIVRSANGVKGKRPPVPLTITKEDAWQLFLKQNRKCALSGVELSFPKVNKGTYSASMDRIDSSKGYEPGNVQWVHKDVNFMKNKFDVDYFISVCKLIAKNN